MSFTIPLTLKVTLLSLCLVITCSAESQQSFLNHTEQCGRPAANLNGTKRLPIDRVADGLGLLGELTMSDNATKVSLLTGFGMREIVTSLCVCKGDRFWNEDR